MGVSRCQRSRWGGTGRALEQEGSFLYSGCHYGAQLVEVAGQPLQGQPGEEGGTGADEGPGYTLSVLVTNGWRRSDLNTSAGDSRPPRPLRYLALGE